MVMKMYPALILFVIYTVTDRNIAFSGTPACYLFERKKKLTGGHPPPPSRPTGPCA